MKKKVIKNNAVFLDRDGVINHDYGFVHKIEDFKLRHSVIAGLKFLIKQKYFIFIVTNQSGIAKGIFSENKYKKFTSEIRKLFKKKELLLKNFILSISS